jgi:hypothetical protein
MKKADNSLWSRERTPKMKMADHEWWQDESQSGEEKQASKTLIALV